MIRAEVSRTSLRSVQVALKGISGEAPKVLTRSLNRTAQKAQTEGSKEIRKQVNLKAAYVKARLKVNKASYRNLTSSITTPVRGVLLSRFSTDRTISGDGVSWIRPPKVPSRGIRVKVDPSSGAKVVSGHPETTGKPFYIVLKNSGRVAIAGRRTTPGPRGGKLKVFYGPSLSQVFDDVVDDIQGPMGDFLQKEADKNIAAVLRGY